MLWSQEQLADTDDKRYLSEIAVQARSMACQIAKGRISENMIAISATVLYSIITKNKRNQNWVGFHESESWESNATFCN